jgi:hypothetical protein
MSLLLGEVLLIRKLEQGFWWIFFKMCQIRGTSWEINLEKQKFVFESKAQEAGCEFYTCKTS